MTFAYFTPSRYNSLGIVWVIVSMLLSLRGILPANQNVGILIGREYSKGREGDFELRLS